MLIINAPTFFSMFWGVLKKFIDPRTAQRIQVFSNSAKGLAALRKLVDETEIPVDYGGTNKSIKQAFVQEASDPLLKRQEIELVYVKKKGKVSFPKEIALNASEYLQIRVYTRSVSSAKVAVCVDGTTYAEVKAMCLWSCGSSNQNGNTSTDTSVNTSFTDCSNAASTVPLPHCTLVTSDLQGPGTVTIQVEDLDTTGISSDKKGRLPRGYFLVVCDVRVKAG